MGAATAMKLTLLIDIIWLVGGWRTWGVLPTDHQFVVYAGKFCFDFEPGPDVQAGRFHFQLQGRVLAGPHSKAMQSTQGPPCYGPCETDGNFYLLVFDDEEAHWAKVNRDWDTLTCEEMLHFASFAMTLSPFDTTFNRTVYVHESVRPRFWYFTFAACNITVVEPIRYEIHAENLLQTFQSEFGIDKQDSVQLQLLAALMFMTLALVLRHVAKRATGAEALRSRPLLRMLFLSTTCSALGALCLTLHWVVYMVNGHGVSPLEVIGTVGLCCARALLTLLQLLTAKGWALFYAPDELVQRRLMICILAGIVITTFACEIHGQYFHDSSTTLYLYESWPGMVILLLNFMLWIEAWRSMCETYRHETSDEVRIFYVVTSSALFVYFLTLPVMCILAKIFDPWVRYKYISRAEVASRFIATLCLFFCLRPTRLDAMVSARLEEGLETVGELRDDVEESQSNEDSEDEALCGETKDSASAGLIHNRDEWA